MPLPHSVVNKLYLCQFCHRKCSSPSELLRHNRIHLNLLSFKCPNCPRVFGQESNRNTHLKSHHLKNHWHQCSYCGKQFMNKADYARHIGIHTGYKGFLCKLCKRGFHQRGNMVIHKQKHNGMKNEFYRCHYCEKHFTNKLHFLVHERRHTGAKPFECRQCLKGFNQQSSLTNHQRIHVDIKAYKCDHCETLFVQKSSADQHRRMHTGDKPYKCRFCQRNFPIKSKRILHENRHYNGNNYNKNK